MIDRAGALAHEASRAEHGEVRDALDLVAPRELREGLGIDLQHQRLAGEVMSGLLHFWCNGATWATPGRPEVDEHRYARRGDDLVELRFGSDLDRSRMGWKRSLALAALAGVGEVANGD